jgi:hypothetical protein
MLSVKKCFRGKSEVNNGHFNLEFFKEKPKNDPEVKIAENSYHNIDSWCSFDETCYGQN